MRVQGFVKGLKRGELAQKSGCHIETIRYYEKIGLLPEPPRTAAGYRQYEKAHLQRLRFILRGRQLGFEVEDIRGLLRLVDGGNQTCAEVSTRTEAHLEDIRAKIADLRRIERTLARTAALCSGDSVPECPVIEELFGDDTEAQRTA